MPKDIQQPWELIVSLIGFFGSIITILLSLIGFMVSRWSKRLDTRLDVQDGEITELKIVTGKHGTEIRNLRHRLNEV